MLLKLLVISSLINYVTSQLCDCGTDPVVELPKITKIDPTSHQFLDVHGRTRWFHGTNVVTKYHPYHPNLGGPTVCNSTLPSPFCDSDMDYFQELGINVIRLGVMWPGAEPIRGEYNCSYFCVIHGIINSLAERGIYTLIDVHQDVMARQFCQNGVPDWVVKRDWIANESFRFPVPYLPEPFTTDEYGIPDPWSQCWEIKEWFLSYLTISVGDAYQRLYDNHDGLLDSFSNYWGRIAQEFKNYSSVMGYNLLNEPWAGDIYSDPTLLIPGVADRKNLEHVWELCNTKIREADPETIVLFEGITWDIADGHEGVPGGDGSKAGMSYHYYAPPQLGLHVMFQNRLRDQERHGTGGILTEFRTWAPSEEEDAGDIHIKMVDTLDAADKYLQSWMGWDHRSLDDRSNGVAKHYARTYAPAVAGRVIKMGFDEDTADFFIIWMVNKSITAPTELKLNKRFYYGDGFDLKIIPGNFATWEEVDEQNLIVRYTDDAITGENITVKITPKEVTDPPTSTSNTEQTTESNGANWKQSGVSVIMTTSILLLALWKK